MTKPTVLLGLALAAFCFGCRSSQPTEAAPRAGLPAAPRPRTRPDAPLLPDPKMTPGATLPVTARRHLPSLATPRRSATFPLDVKQQVYAEYGITSHKPGDYEVDHLISLELGGSNSIKNLWPQSYLTQPWNAHVKDALENELHDEVCSGRLDLATAQHDIATDWIAAYKKYFHTNVPLSKGGGYDNGVYVGGGRHKGRSRHPLTGAIPNSPPHPLPRRLRPPTCRPWPAGQVWVNLKSGKYFRPGSSYYGHTKQGQYMSEAARPGARVRRGERAVEDYGKQPQVDEFASGPDDHRHGKFGRGTDDLV